MNRRGQTSASKLHAWRNIGALILASALMGVLAGLAAVYAVHLPQARQLAQYRPMSDTELYDDQGRIIGSFALERRVIAAYADYPKVLYDAVISIEDKDFENHSGFAIWRILGAARRDVTSGAKVQGASTLTMQLARNLCLTPERTYSRKLKELLLAIQIERQFTKQQIFTLYANQVYLGHGTYGLATAAQFYFGKQAKDLTLEEAAMLAAMLKAPSNYSPIKSPERALARRNQVITSMWQDGKISLAEANRARQAPIKLSVRSDPNSLAPHFVEEVRQYLEKKYGSEDVHEAGLRVYTTLDVDMQKAANKAVRDGLAAYERRRGWRGRLPNVRDLGATLNTYGRPEWGQPIEPGTYMHVLVTSVSPAVAQVRFGRYTAAIASSDVSWTNLSLRQLFSVGDLAYVKILSLGPNFEARVQLERDSEAQGALLAIDNTTGDVKAMVGGRDFNESKFNRATQALRQVGSSFKPYVYAAAIDEGAMPDDIVLDAPVTFRTVSGPYTPHNYDQKFEGAITLRHALADSRNIPALRLADHVGIKKVIGYAHRFGIKRPIPAYLPVALGAVELTLLEHTSAFSAFPNDGVRMIPRYVVKVTDHDGRVLEENYSAAEDVLSERTARIMTSMLREVVLHGTAAAASRMEYPLAGKTGTTNDFTDAWFIGFSPSTTCGVWIGFDEKKSLGPKETGAMAALPVWMKFMGTALANEDVHGEFRPPPQIEKTSRFPTASTTAQAGDFSQ